MKKLQRSELITVFGGAMATAICVNNNTGHEYTLSCSGGSSCTSSDYNGCKCYDGGELVAYQTCETTGIF